jgi:serine protease AprX
VRYAIIAATVEQVKSVGATDIKEARSAGIIFATLTEEQAARLRSQGCTVSKVGEVRTAVMPPIVAPPVPVAAAPTYTPEQLVWAAGMEDLRGITKPPLYGEGFNLAIIDSGIRETHTKINGRVVYRKNFTSDRMGDTFNHGTGVCSIALAVAPLCNILNLKVLDDKGSGTEEDVALAIDDCIALHDTEPTIAPSVINLSLGAPDDGNPYNPLRVACRAAIDKGIWVIASAGNGGAPRTITSPACERYVGAAGSAKYLPDQQTFVVSNFSSRGPTLEGLTKPDLLLFGEDIVVASSESDTATVAKSGTSFATPFASGMVLGFLEGLLRRAVPIQEIPGVYPELGIWYFTPADVIDKYLAGVTIKPQGIPAGKDNDYGYGLPFGPLIAQTLELRPAVDISAMLTPVLAIVLLGMVTTTMAKAFR